MFPEMETSEMETVERVRERERLPTFESEAGSDRLEKGTIIHLKLTAYGKSECGEGVGREEIFF